MPDVTVRQEEIGHYIITMEIKNALDVSYYNVGLYYLHDDGTCGNPINNNVYTIHEKEKATACFNRYKRKVKSWIGEV